MSNTNAMVSTDALAPATMPTIDADAGLTMSMGMATDDTQLVASIAETLARPFDSALAQLTRLLDVRYASAIEGLEHEAEALAEEYGLLEEGIRAIEDVLPSEGRLIQHQVDQLLHDGKGQDAKDKLAELAALRSKPGVLRQRMSEIQDRFQSIDHERHDIARETFNKWHGELVCPIIRTAERGLFLTLLEGISDSMYQFQASTATNRSDNKQRPLLNQGHFSSLTADGRSAEWAAGHRWYA